jgi:hypothetical protein
MGGVAGVRLGVDDLRRSECGMNCGGRPALLAARAKSSWHLRRDERMWLYLHDLPDIRILFASARAVKGETYDAVVLHTKHRAYSCGCPQSAGTWKAVVTHSMLQC